MKHFKFLAILAISVFGFSALVAQTNNVTGRIIDENKVGLESAMIVILDAKDSTMLGYGMSDIDGKFKIGGIKKGQSLLQITYIGYGTIQKALDITGNPNTLALGDISLSQDAALLKDVTISAEYVPIKITKDTIEFNADAFKVQPNASVEELLKKLPGVEVDKEGVITVKGEEVKAVTVDGKDFFGKDPKMATRNLPADAVKKVQVFDKKSKNAQFTGVDDGADEKTINLELKENRKNGTFGNAMAGYGTSNRYEGKGIINRFSKKNQWSLIGNANNLNQQGINSSDLGSMAGGMGSAFSSGAPVNWGGQLPQGDIKSVTIGANMNFELSKTNKINLSYYLTNANTLLLEDVNANTFVGDSSLISFKNKNSDSRNLSHSFYTNSDFKIDSTSEMSVNGSFNYRVSDGVIMQMDTTLSFNQNIINRNQVVRDNEVNNHSLSANASYRKKLKKKGRNLAFNGSYGDNANQTINNILSDLYDQTGSLNVLRSYYQLQNNDTDGSNFSIGGTYNEPLKKNWTWSSSASFRNNRSDLIKDFFDIDRIVPNSQTLNIELSRNFDNSYNYATLGQSFRFTKENLNFSAGFDYQNSRIDAVPSIGSPIDRTFQFVLPNVSVEWDKPGIRINYNTNVREPSADQLQPIVDNSDPLNVYQGNPLLDPEYRHNMRLSYNKFDQFNFTSFFANIRMTYTQDKIATATNVNSFGGRFRTPINTDYESSLSGFASYSSPINAIKAKYRVGYNGSFNRGISLLNNTANKIDRISHGFSATLENKNKKHFDISATGRWNNSQNLYLDNETQNTAFLNQTYESALAIFPGKGWIIESKYELYLYDQGSFDQSTSINLLNASVSKLLFKNKWQLKLRAFDLLDQNKGVNRSVSEYAITESVSNTIGRFFMLTALYDIKSFSAASSNSPSMMMMRH